MDLEIFDVEHGACALLTADDGATVMIDCGHNVSTQWYPSAVLRSRNISALDLLIITNYDEDHVSGLPDLRQHTQVRRLWRNPSVSADALSLLKSADGMGNGISELQEMVRRYTGAGEPFVIPGVERSAFHLPYPEFDDENNLSFVTHLKINGIGFLFPGDLETKGWEALLARNAKFRTAVAETQVLIASHHGRWNGVFEDLFSTYGCKPFWVVISDKGYAHESQETVPFYELQAKGAEFRGRSRKVLTTRNDGTIRFSFSGNRWSGY